MADITEQIAEITDISGTRKNVDIDFLRDLQFNMLQRPNLLNISVAFGTIGNEKGLKILYLLAEAGELCVCDLSDITGSSVSAVSQQLRILKDDGFVKSRKELPTIYYSISDNSFINVLVNLVKMISVEGYNQLK